MKARNSSQQPLYLLLLVLACTWSAIEAAPDVCRYFANNTIIRDPDDCSHAIKCVDFKPTSHLKCKGTTPFFNKDTLKCVKELDDHSTCAIDCTEKAQNFLADPKSCTGYYYCFDDELAMRGDCPVGMHFNETQQMCLYQYKSECRVELFDFCSIVKNDVFFNDESSCDAYFYCKKGNFTSAKCKSKYYDPVLGECVQKSQIDCPVHPLPTDVCGTVKKPLKNQFVGDEATCRGYYYCKDLGSAGPQANPIWQVCPENTFFQKSTQSCANPLQVKCDEDRCDGRTLPFVVAGDKGCRDYLRCSNGRTIQKLSCGNYFFNEEQQHCTGMVLQYPACV